VPRAIAAWWSTLSRGWRLFMLAIVMGYVIGIPLAIAFDRYGLAGFLAALCIATFGSLLYLIRSAFPGRGDSFS
jgi:uncharacterized membrane protein